jgi:hypothetical protein
MVPYCGGDLDANPDTRVVYLNFINEAAEEIYESHDPAGCLEEVYVRVQPGSEIALPPFVGELRAVRDVEWKTPFTLKDMRPRYHAFQWTNEWKNWRHKGYSPTCTEITNAAPLRYEITEADETVTVTTHGQTANSNRITDEFVMDDTEKVGVESFQFIESIRKSAYTDYDINIYDVNDNVMSIIYNNELEARYVVIDVSLYPNQSCCGDGRIMEVLYKKRLRKLSQDGDCFPVPDYDKLVADKAIQLWYERQEGKEKIAILKDQKIARTIQQKMQHKEGPLIKSMRFNRNPLLGRFRKGGCYPYISTDGYPPDVP